MLLLVACTSGFVLAGQDQDLSKSGQERQKIYLREGVTYIEKDGAGLQVIVTSTLADIYPSQTCWGETFDIYVSGVTGNLDASCFGYDEIPLSLALWEEDGGLFDPDDRVREIWLNFPTNGQTSGVPYEYLFGDVVPPYNLV